MSSVGYVSPSGDPRKVDTTDPRLADARVPKSHAASHATDASDPVTPASIGALDQTAGDGRYERVFPVAAPTGVAATDTARITAQATAASNAGGGTVALRSGVYRLNAPLPVLSGVTYRGVPPVLASDNVNNTQYMPDGEFHFVDGTVLQGDGTFRAFEGNATDQGTVQTDIGNTQISGAGLYGLGLDGFTDGIKIGAVNIMGLVYSKIDEVYVRNCSGWAVFLANFQHIEVGTIRSCTTVHGHYYASLLPSVTLNPGNSLFRELFHKVPNASRVGRGIVFDAAGTNAILGEIHVLNLQVNAFNRQLLAVSASLTSGSSAIAVPDGSLWQVGMLAAFTATANGFTANKVYVVKSVAGNAITLADYRNAAAIVASGTGTGTLQTYGVPNLEVIAQPGASGLRSGRFHNVDVEGAASAGVYAESVQLADFSISAIPTNGTQAHVVGRNSPYCNFHVSQIDTITDFDSLTATGSTYRGGRSATYGYPLAGWWRDGVLNTECFAVGPGLTGQTGGDIHRRANNFLYPAAGMGEKVFGRDTAISLNGTQCGDVVYAGSAAVTFTLPTIANASTTANQVGLWFEIYNCGTGTITVNTGGSQLLNKITGKASTTVAPGTSLKLIAVQDAGGSLFWAAKASTLVT